VVATIKDFAQQTVQFAVALPQRSLSSDEDRNVPKARNVYRNRTAFLFSRNQRNAEHLARCGDDEAIT
jgi:hypothetical protein